MLSINSLKSKKGDVTGLMSSILASIGWSLFGLTWPAVSTEEMFVSIAYLWYVIGIIFALIATYTGMRMLGSIFQTKQRRLVLQDTDEEETE